MKCACKCPIAHLCFYFFMQYFNSREYTSEGGFLSSDILAASIFLRRFWKTATTFRINRSNFGIFYDGFFYSVESEKTWRFRSLVRFRLKLNHPAKTASLDCVLLKGYHSFESWKSTDIRHRGVIYWFAKRDNFLKLVEKKRAFAPELYYVAYVIHTVDA